MLTIRRASLARKVALAWLSERGHSHIHRGQRIEEASLEQLDLTKQLMANGRSWT